jgi:spermidine/putrescine ABC transporter ATP-binding subunit
MSSFLELRGITHRYETLDALKDVTLEIDEGTFLTLLGSSGSGKTTLLRVIAGFIRPSEGRVILDGEDITGVQAHRRPVNTVFQRPTLFPHLDVFENVAFGLRVARLGRDEVRARVHEALELVRLPELAHRRSHELSGGQMQRITLARALVNRPRVLLLDEPLGALDLKIRLEMETELRRVHRETGTTFVYVTHDQREALALSDLVALVEEGEIRQLAEPRALYETPSSPFAARFVGDANVLPARVVARSGGQATVELGGHRVALSGAAANADGAVSLVVRPESVRVRRVAGRAEGAGIPGKLRDFAFRGSSFSCQVEVDGLPELVKAEIPARDAHGLEVDCDVVVQWDVESIRVLPPTPTPAPASGSQDS